MTDFVKSINAVTGEENETKSSTQNIKYRVNGQDKTIPILDTLPDNYFSISGETGSSSAVIYGANVDPIVSCIRSKGTLDAPGSMTNGVTGKYDSNAYVGTVGPTVKSTGTLTFTLDSAIGANADEVNSSWQLSHYVADVEVVTMSTPVGTNFNKSHIPILINDTADNVNTISFDGSSFTPQLFSQNSGVEDGNIAVYGNSSNNGGTYFILASNGTFAAPTSLGVGDLAGFVGWGGYSAVGGANTYFPMATITSSAAAAPTATGVAGKVLITAYDGTTDGTNFLELDGEKQVNTISRPLKIDNQGNTMDTDSNFSVFIDAADVKGTQPITRGTSAQRLSIASPSNGLQFYDTTLNEKMTYDAALSQWRGGQLFEVNISAGEWASSGGTNPPTTNTGDDNHIVSGEFKKTERRAFQLNRTLTKEVYKTGADLKVTVWWSQAILGGAADQVVWGLTVTPLASGELIPVTPPIITTQAFTVPHVVNLTAKNEFTVSGATLTAGDLVLFQFFRDGLSATDDFLQSAFVYNVRILEVRT